jgi:cytidine deaminase
MQKKQHIITIEEYDNDSELNESDLHLLKEARTAAEAAYAPYSSFHVGAALRLENGKIIHGNNQENVAYPSGLCAERVAIFAASAIHPGETILTVAVSCYSDKTGSDKPFSPCGACRQVLVEYEQKQRTPIRIILGGRSGKILVPLVFEADQLRS